MPKITTVRLKDHIAAEVMLQVACVMRADGGQLEPRFVAGPDDGEDLEPELELFMDWDGLRVDGRGTYAQDDDECRSRRVDLRGPTDADPGPLPMEEAPEDITAKHLILRPSAP